MGQLKVLQIGKFYPPDRGGMETHLESLCRALHREVSLDVLVANQGPRTVRETLDGVKLTRAGMPVRLASAPICPEFPRLIRQSPADIVHIHLPHPTAILAYLSSKHRGRLVLTYHSDIVRQRCLAFLLKPLMNAALRRCSTVIVTSPDYLDTSSVLAAFRDKCRVVPLGVRPPAPARPEDVADIRLAFGPRIILAVGRLVYYKGFDCLIRAMTHVRARLLIVGNGPLRERLAGVAREFGVSDRVRLLGNIEDLAPYYQACDVFVLPSVARSEAFGLVQLEAMACGKPIINTRLDSGVPFVSPHGLTGFCVPPADSRALSNALNLLLDDGELRERFGRAARDRFEKLFSIDAMIGGTLDVYYQAIGNATPASAAAAKCASASAR